MANESGVLAEGARRVWRYQRILWWMFVVNLGLAVFAALPVSTRIGKVTDHSLYAQRLSHGFDATALIELATHPEVSFSSGMPGSLASSFVFFVFTLFLTGGILETYFGNRKLSTGGFFEACGNFFWRWVRLLLFMLIFLVPIGILASSIVKWSGKLANSAAAEKLGFWVEVGGLLLVVFLSMCVRLWFDMAQIRVVAENQRAVRRSLRAAFRQTLENFGSLFWLYFRASLLAWAALAIVLWAWTRIPPARSGVSFIVLELLLLWWLGTRLWQRAAETTWYERHLATAIVLPMPPIEPAGPDFPGLPSET
jgi:hypothetical protein